jgi:hypothetical protein
MLPVAYLRPAETYLKKIKDAAICKDPSVGTPKVGDLAGIMGYDIKCQGNWIRGCIPRGGK